MSDPWEDRIGGGWALNRRLRVVGASESRRWKAAPAALSPSVQRHNAAARRQSLWELAEFLWVVFLFACLLTGWFVILREIYQGTSYLIGVLR